jgi:GNAT superfamily N-acetyltransferase
MNHQPKAGSDPAEETDWMIRPAQPDDAAAVAELYEVTRRAAIPAMPAPVHGPEEDQRYFAALLAGGFDLTAAVDGTSGVGTETWVADRDGVVLGFAVLQPGWLHSLYVHPEEAGSGIGSALLEVAKARRPDGFSLWVFTSNLPARGFYARRGLVELEATDGRDNEERAPDVKMAWPGREPVEFYRRLIDDIDDQLGVLLGQRAALTAAVRRHRQQFPPDTGSDLRDRERELAVVARIADRAPGLGSERIGRIVHAIIEESVSAADHGPA